MAFELIRQAPQLPLRESNMETVREEAVNAAPTRWWRFSLKFLLLVLTATGVWLAAVSNRARSQKRAVDRVQELGGGVAFDYQFDANMNWRKDPKLPAPVWLIDLIGEDAARSVTIVNFDDGSDPTDDELVVVERLTDLKQLTLMNRKRITDDGLRHLIKLSKLEVLALNGTNIRGKGLQNVVHMQQLTGLTLDNTPLTDDALEYIGQLDNLQWLFLSNTRITDDGLKHIATLRRLEDLQLRGTSITDEGVKHLYGMTSLTRILLGDDVSREGRAALQAKLPKCQVN
jgi:Leucine-rich repeat (LRR) protein